MVFIHLNKIIKHKNEAHHFDEKKKQTFRVLNVFNGSFHSIVPI